LVGWSLHLLPFVLCSLFTIEIRYLLKIIALKSVRCQANFSPSRHGGVTHPELLFQYHARTGSTPDTRHEPWAHSFKSKKLPSFDHHQDLFCCLIVPSGRLHQASKRSIRVVTRLAGSRQVESSKRSRWLPSLALPASHASPSELTPRRLSPPQRRNQLHIARPNKKVNLLLLGKILSQAPNNLAMTPLSTMDSRTTNLSHSPEQEEEEVHQQQTIMMKQQTSGADVDILEHASSEIEQMRSGYSFHSFPPACLSMLKRLEGNSRCVDCGEQNPQWAACRYGAMLCLNCSGHHRSLGVQVSSVRSISMDEWSVTEVVSMLEGGNQQIGNFFERHNLTVGTCESVGHNGKERTINRDNVTRLRYKTKAALFYRRQMELHVANIMDNGPYRGREISRRLNHHPLEKRNSTVD